MQSSDVATRLCKKGGCIFFRSVTKPRNHTPKLINRDHTERTSTNVSAIDF